MTWRRHLLTWLGAVPTADFYRLSENHYAAEEKHGQTIAALQFTISESLVDLRNKVTAMSGVISRIAAMQKYEDLGKTEKPDDSRNPS